MPPLPSGGASHRRPGTLVLATLILALGAAAAPARASVFYDATLDLGLSDDARIFLNVTNDYFAPPPPVAVDLVRRCRVPVDDFPTILFLARVSKRPPDSILHLRLDYLSWSDIMERLKVQPSVLFTGLDRDPGPPYGKAWGYWRKHPHDESLRFRDRDVVELVKLQVGSRCQRVSPYAIASVRQQEIKVERYVAERNRGRYSKTKGGSHAAGQGKPKGSGKPPGHDKPHGHD
ncbi:MAG TPA: hypothetical protein VKF61_00155 [Candidatus Polarisedimenticolia bacterium]|nr:hypothetical protein [Candidatus Polarisedimenticolia bacterium]